MRILILRMLNLCKIFNLPNYGLLNRVRKRFRVENFLYFSIF
jgi:hypothetical protein